MIEILLSKPVLIGLHLGSAIIGIDAFLWLLGDVKSGFGSASGRFKIALVGLVAYILTWIIGGYYYVKFYGPLVKPIIKAGQAPWAHGIVMELKEHVFLFAVPIAFTILMLSRLEPAELESRGLRRGLMMLLIISAGLGLSLGLMGFTISAAARWGAL